LLEQRSSDAAAADRVRFAGPITEFDALREVFGHSLASVVPGSAGLSLVQSLWFGVPVIVARDESHGPELEAVEEGRNGILVDSNAPASLRRAILSVVHERARWTDRRRQIAAACVASYALEETIGGLTSAIDGSCP
jgi:glycosyltransferase involved in cell wall biosynthesis